MQRLEFWRLDNDGIHALMSVHAHLARSRLERSLLDLVYVRVSELTSCTYCIDAHVQDAIEHGLDRGLVNDVAAWREAPSFSDRQRAALAWTDSVTEIARTQAPDEVYRQATQEFSDAELVDLTLAIALMNAFARIAVAFRHGPPPMPALIDSAAAR